MLVTNRDFREYLDWNFNGPKPSLYGGDDDPVLATDSDSARDYATWRAEREGIPWSLPETAPAGICCWTRGVEEPPLGTWPDEARQALERRWAERDYPALARELAASLELDGALARWNARLDAREAEHEAKNPTPPSIREWQNHGARIPWGTPRDFDFAVVSQRVELWLESALAQGLTRLPSRVAHALTSQNSMERLFTKQIGRHMNELIWAARCVNVPELERQQVARGAAIVRDLMPAVCRTRYDCGDLAGGETAALLLAGLAIHPETERRMATAAVRRGVKLEQDLGRLRPKPVMIWLEQGH